MSVKYGKFEMPEKLVLEKESQTTTFGRFIAEPFEPGYGHTIGNFMRRVLLTSMEAAAIISVRIQGVSHEFMAIEGVVEDMVSIILNLKMALLRKLPASEDLFSRDSRILTTSLHITQDMIDKAKGQYSVTLGQLVSDSNFDVVNPDLHLFYVTKPFKKQIDVRVAFGRGYVPSERVVVRDKTVDEIIIDAIYSPVRKVNYIVENTRVGQDTDYDRLILEVTTDGRITPEEAVTFASQIGIKHFDVFNKIKSLALSFDEGMSDFGNENDKILNLLCQRVNEIELTVRSANCLEWANITTLAELVANTERKLLEFRNFGKKSLNEIKAKLESLGLHLGMDLKRFGIDPENVKDDIARIIEMRRSKSEKKAMAEQSAENSEVIS
jgi:DNA-directed RNA polymerase subunit alpha